MEPVSQGVKCCVFKSGSQDCSQARNAQKHEAPEQTPFSFEVVRKCLALSNAQALCCDSLVETASCGDTDFSAVPDHSCHTREKTPNDATGCANHTSIYHQDGSRPALPRSAKTQSNACLQHRTGFQMQPQTFVWIAFEPKTTSLPPFCQPPVTS